MIANRKEFWFKLFSHVVAVVIAIVVALWQKVMEFLID
jgi:hypothetical protein